MRVLVVDDSAVLRSAIARMLEQMGHETTLAENGMEALAQVKAQAPDLVLMDANMPVMDGYEAARRIRAFNPDDWVPIIFLSASEGDQDLQKGIEAGGDDYLVKPVSFVVLEAKIRAMRRIEEMRQKILAISAQLASANRELDRLSNQDGLTKIANRRHFDNFLEHELARAVRHAKPVGLVLLDVDHFKLYNDVYGHPKGDECLRRVADALRSRCRRAPDLAARIGGEEFALVLPETDASGTWQVGREACAAVAALLLPHEASPTSAFVSISAGAAASEPGAPLDATRLLARADEALYLAKGGGRNRCVLAP